MSITYQPEGSGAADSDCAPASFSNEAAPQTRTNTTAIIVDVPNNQSDDVSAAWTTPANEPGVADWPNGLYEGSYECTSINTSLSVQVQILRVNSGCTIQQTLATSGEFAGTGVHSVSITTDPSSGATGDRFQMRCLADSTNTHGSPKTFTVAVDDPDTFMGGPWVAAVADTPQQEFPGDAALYAQGVTGPELGITVAPLAGDVVVVSDIPQQEFPHDIDLYTHPVTSDEASYSRAPLAKDEHIPAPVRPPQDMAPFTPPVSEHELGFTMRGVIEDLVTPERPALVTTPGDMDLFRHRPTSDEQGFSRPPLAEDIVIEARPIQAPQDMSFYTPEPTLPELGSTLAPQAGDLRAGAEVPADMAPFTASISEDEQGFQKSTPAESVFPDHNYNTVPIETFWYTPPVTADEQGFQRPPLAENLEQPVTPVLFPEDMSLYGFEPIGPELSFTRGPAPEDVAPPVLQPFPAVFPNDIACFGHPLTPDEQSFTRSTPPESVTWVDAGTPFLHTTANWDSSERWYLEAYMKATSGILQARLFNQTDAVDVPSSQIGTASAVLTRVRSTGFTLIDGKEYVVQFGTVPSDAGAWKLARLVYF